MAAGLGFKTFSTGDVLSATDVNGYLMQGILVFASATARDAAITAPAEGQFAYLKDTNVTTYYTGSAWANVDTTGMTNPMTTTGDTIYSSSGSTPARLGIGTAGQVLQVNSGATAPEWATPAGGVTYSGVSVTKTTTQSAANNSFTTLSFDSEQYDTDGYHDNVTNNSRLTIPSGKNGYYSVTGLVRFAASATGERIVILYKNGSEVAYLSSSDGTTNNPTVLSISYTLNLVATDFIRLDVYQTSGGSLNIQEATFFQLNYLGA
jgi:hypothetical protein